MGDKYDCINTHRTLGEMAIVEDHATCGMRAKLQDRGKPAMFVGATHEHTRDTYRFNRIIMSRNIVWTGKSYGEYYNIYPPQLPALQTRIILDKPTDGSLEAQEVAAPPGLSDAVDNGDHIDSLSDEEEDDFIADENVIIKLKKCVNFKPTPPPRVVKPLVHNEAEPERVPWAVELVNILYPMPGMMASGHLLMVEKVDSIVNAFDNVKPIKYKDMFEVPLTFEQKWNHPFPWQRQHWGAAILLELAKMK
jgi:hypothetical protein